MSKTEPSKHGRRPPPTQSRQATAHNINDPRFISLLSGSDPRFRPPSKKRSHVSLDPRFAHMLRDERFSSRAKVDRYGRKLPKEQGRRELERYYKIDGEEEQDMELEEGSGPVKGKNKDIRGALGKLRVAESVSEEEEVSSSEDSSSEDENVSDKDEEEVFGVLPQQEEREGDEGLPECDPTNRVAATNLDWDHIRAADLMAVFGSFVPSARGRIEKVAIYPSEFGKQRMGREELEGPPKEIFESRQRDGVEVDEDGNESREDYDSDEAGEVESKTYNDEDIKRSIVKEDAGLEFNSAKLRQYQNQRLQYYYAVVTCSSISAAQGIVEEVDGIEYLNSANVFELRYIPDDTDFSDDTPRDVCERVPDGYRPTEFVTDALQHSNVRLTWDADDAERKEAQKRAFKGGRKEIDENDLKAYLGSDSSDEEYEAAPKPVVVDATDHIPSEDGHVALVEGTSAPELSKKEMERQKMRALLGLPAQPVARKPRGDQPVAGDIQVTFTAALTGNGKKSSVFENTPEEAQETTAEKYIRKEKERKARRKEKMKAKRDGVDTADQQNDLSASDAGVDGEQLADGNKDLGFDDPFFTASKPANAAIPKVIKPAKREKRRQREAEEAALAASRSKLEPLLANNTDDAVEHFDIKALARAEKVSKKKGKKKHLSERDREALEKKSQDHFKMDVKDDRFRDLFERPEFAVDPSHPRFLATEGMKKVLEEGRRKKGVADDGEERVQDRAKRQGKRKADRDEENLETLIKRVKRGQRA